MNPILEGEVNGEVLRVPLSPGTFLIGREHNCDVRLPHRSVSREHAEIRVEPDRVTVRDLGSRNGTRINERVIQGDEELAPGDRLRFGNVELVISGWNEPSPPTFHSTDQILLDADRLHASQRLPFDARSGGDALPDVAEKKLLQAVAEAGRLLAANQPLDAVFESVLDLVEKTTHARRVVLLLGGAGENSRWCRPRAPRAPWKNASCSAGRWWRRS